MSATNCAPSSLPASRPLRHASVLPKDHVRQKRSSRMRPPSAIQEAAEALQTTAHYVPSPLDPTIQAAQLGSAVAVFSLLFVWWGVVVPSARKKLSKDKRKGPLREYLEAVDADETRLGERWFFSKWLTQMPGREKARQRNLAAQGLPESVQSEADPAAEEARSQKPAPSVVEKFLSADNPIIVVVGILGVFVAIQVALHDR